MNTTTEQTHRMRLFQLAHGGICGLVAGLLSIFYSGGSFNPEWTLVIMLYFLVGNAKYGPATQDNGATLITALLASGVWPYLAWKKFDQDFLHPTAATYDAYVNDAGSCTGTPPTYAWEAAKALTRSYAGKSDWRLPTIAELNTIVERAATNPSINSVIFPNTSATMHFWTTTTSYDFTNYAWVILPDGCTQQHPKGTLFHARLVRGGQPVDSSGLYTPTSDFTDNGDGTVTHNKTNLMWKRCTEGMVWNNGCIGSAQLYTFADATLLAQQNYAGKGDWRLPTQNELLSIVEWSVFTPAITINSTIFPLVSSQWYVSSSDYFSSTTALWGTFFRTGLSLPGNHTLNKVNTYSVRLVRGVQSATGPISLAGLSLSCPVTLASSSSDSCSATSSYSDGTSKVVSPVWSSSNEALLNVSSSGNLVAGVANTNTVVTVSAVYSENGTSKTATAAVTIKAAAAATAAVLTNLLAACPSTINAGMSAVCSTTASYSDGSSKVVNATWTSSNTSVATVSGFSVTANAGIITDTPVLLNAAYSENGITKTANVTVTVTAATAQATNDCNGTDRYLTGITIAGNAAKKVGDTLDVNYCLKNFSKVSRFDIYIAVKVPDNSLLYMKSAGFFGTPVFNSSVTPYLKNTLLPDLSGLVLSLPELPLEMPLGSYTFYAVPVLTGKSVENTANWIGQISQGAFTLSW